jgi:hypothetical protein
MIMKIDEKLNEIYELCRCTSISMNAMNEVLKLQNEAIINQNQVLIEILYFIKQVKHDEQKKII